MKIFFKNYRNSIILILAIILGGTFGLIFKEKTDVVKPLGDLFLNLLLVIIIPLIFSTITSSIGKMSTPKRIGKILGTTIIVFIIASLVSVFIGLISANSFKLINNNDIAKVKETLVVDADKKDEEVNFLSKTVDTLSVNNFSKLLTNENIIALIVFAILFGIAINLAKEKGKAVLNLLDSLNEVLQKFIKIIMYYAPIGLGCYFAVMIGNFGGSLVVGYTKTLVIYTITAVLFYFIVYSLYAFIAAGKKGFATYWKNIIPPTITALATCSSAASIPANTIATKKMGVPSDIADCTIPLGTSFHKDGSIIGSVFKIMFLVCLFGSQISILEIIGIALVATLLIAAIPIGGGTISETLIITMLGFPLGALPFLTIIATIIDAPATVLNVVGDSASSMMVSRIVDGKNWLIKATSSTRGF